MMIQWAFIGVLVLFVLFLLLRFNKSLIRWSIGLGVASVVLVLAWALLTQAQANRRMATAVTVASAGQTTSSVAVALLAGLLVLVLLAGGGIVFYLLRRVRRLEDQIGERGNTAAANSERAAHIRGTALQDLVHLETLRLLHEMRLTQRLDGIGTGSARTYLALEDPALEDTDWGSSADWANPADWNSPDEDNDFFWG